MQRNKYEIHFVTVDDRVNWTILLGDYGDANDKESTVILGHSPTMREALDEVSTYVP